MKNQRGFTLIELLVVISIIALLMSILMPTLAKVRSAARAAACQMNQRQLGIIFNMYTSDNNGFFTDGQRTTGAAGIGDWLTALDGGYNFYDPKTQAQIDQSRENHRTLSYIKDYGILVCPMAMNPSRDGPIAYRAWGGGPGYEIMTNPNTGYLPYAPEDVIGSFAQNAWCTNTPIGARQDWECDTRFCWRTTAAKGAADIPVLADSYRWGCNPKATDAPPDPEGFSNGSLGRNEIARVCINRHNGAIDILFMDWSSRRVGLKDLWDINIRWHRNWTNEWEEGQVDGIEWPDWMRNF